MQGPEKAAEIVKRYEDILKMKNKGIVFGTSFVADDIQFQHKIILCKVFLDKRSRTNFRKNNRSDF